MKPEMTFFVEPLERRFMLSGNIIATIIGGDLWGWGDEFDNDISLEVIENQTVLVGNNDTTINGTTNQFVVSDGNSIEDDLFVSTGSGDDQFVIRGVEIDGAVRIFTGAGNGTVGLSETAIDGRLRLKTGSGDDSVALQSTNSQRALIFTGAGDDLVSLEEIETAGATKVSTSSGADDVVIRNSSFGGRLVSRTGSGADDILIEGSSVVGNLLSVSGSADDIVRVDDTSVQRKAVLVLNSGDDIAEITGNSTISRRLLVVGGGGEDAISVATTVATTAQTAISFESNDVDVTEIDLRVGDGDLGATAQAAQLQSQIFGETTDTDTATTALSIDTSSNNLTPSNGVFDCNRQ